MQRTKINRMWVTNTMYWERINADTELGSLLYNLSTYRQWENEEFLTWEIWHLSDSFTKIWLHHIYRSGLGQLVYFLLLRHHDTETLEFHRLLFSTPRTHTHLFRMNSYKMSPIAQKSCRIRQWVPVTMYVLSYCLEIKISWSLQTPLWGRQSNRITPCTSFSVPVKALSKARE